MIAIETVNDKSTPSSPAAPSSLESSENKFLLLLTTSDQRKLYQCIEENRTEEAMELFALPSLGIDDEKIQFFVNKKVLHNGTQECDVNYWSMMQWACFHGNEKVSSSVLDDILCSFNPFFQFQKMNFTK